MRVTGGNFIAEQNRLRKSCLHRFHNNKDISGNVSLLFGKSSEIITEWVCNGKWLAKNDKIGRYTHLVTVKEGEQVWRRL